MGNKYKLLPQLLELFPKNVDMFYDIFGGSGCVCVNSDCNNIVYNELNTNIYDLSNMLINIEPDILITKINNYIAKYNLNTEGTDVRQNNPDIKEIRDYYNDKYLQFRNAYNKQDNKDIVMLYTLTFYSFSNLIRFNKNNDFNMPFGNRCFCIKHTEQIKEWYELIHKKHVTLYNRDAFELLSNTNFSQNDFVYLDPPYTNTLAIYNEQRANGGWCINDDFKLFDILESLNKQGVRWGLSNVFKNKSSENTHLIEWCKKNNWNIYHLNHTYSALGKGNANSDEVYICNYSNLDLSDLD